MMGLLFKVFIIVVLIGIGVQQHWFDAVLSLTAAKVGPAVNAALPAAAELGQGFFQTVSAMIGALPEPWNKIALGLGILLGLGALFSAITVLVAGVIRIMRKLSDLAV